MIEVPVIAIDGPAAVGKSTIAYRLASELEYNILISGALYRVVAMHLRQQQIDINDIDAIKNLIKNIKIEFLLRAEKLQILLSGQSIEEEISQENYADAASQISKMAEIRDALLPVQRRFEQPPGLVAEGRDMGTIVFPKASLKIFLEADLEERVKRRYNQLKQHRVYVTLENLKKEILQRDQRDRSRSVAPLRIASDAIICDTTQQTVDDTVGCLKKIINAKLHGKN